MATDFASAALDDCLSHFAQVRLRVSGRCMEPVLPEGAAVILESADRRRPRWGDVVLVRHAVGLRLHRLIWCPSFGQAWRTVGHGWRTQADGSCSCDPRAAPADILATALAIEGNPDGLRSRTAALRSLARAVFSRARAFLPR
jgi:hypothetical protein